MKSLTASIGSATIRLVDGDYSVLRIIHDPIYRDIRIYPNSGRSWFNVKFYAPYESNEYFKSIKESIRETYNMYNPEWKSILR